MSFTRPRVSRFIVPTLQPIVPYEEVENQLSRYQRSLMRELYRDSGGNLFATHAGTHIFLGSIRNRIYKESVDIEVSEKNVRKSLTDHPELAEAIIQRAHELAEEFLKSFHPSKARVRYSLPNFFAFVFIPFKKLGVLIAR